MGYAIVFSACCSCGEVFGYNPHSVPSARDTQGVRQPICRPCVEKANPIRKAKGLPEITILPDAYEPISEYEL